MAKARGTTVANPARRQGADQIGAMDAALV